MPQESKDRFISRQDVDSPYKRNIAPNSYKNRGFAGKRTTTDGYTGKKVYYSDRGAEGVHRHYTTKTTSNVDHVTPIDVLIKRYGDKIPLEDLQRIANSDYNLIITNEALNKQKGGATNIQYLLDRLKKGSPEDAVTTLRMIAAQLKSETAVGASVTQVYIRESAPGKFVLEKVEHLEVKLEAKAPAVTTTLSSAHEAGKAAALVALTVSGLNNLAAVASGEKELADALKDVAEDTALSYVSGAGMKLAQDLVSDIATKAGADSIAQFAAEGFHTAEIALVAMTAKNVGRYLTGEISGEDCAIAILSNGAGALAYSLGYGIGGPAGAYVASLVATQITNTILEYRQEQRIRVEMDAEVAAVLSDAMQAIETQKDRLKNYVDAELKRWDDTVEAGFEQIRQAIDTQDTSGVSRGLEEIMSLFNSHVYYPTPEAFKKDFLDPDAEPLIM